MAESGDPLDQHIRNQMQLGPYSEDRHAITHAACKLAFLVRHHYGFNTTPTRVTICFWSNNSEVAKNKEGRVSVAALVHGSTNANVDLLVAAHETKQREAFLMTTFALKLDGIIEGIMADFGEPLYVGKQGQRDHAMKG